MREQITAASADPIDAVPTVTGPGRGAHPPADGFHDRPENEVDTIAARLVRGS
ncbi:hypothetical protein [Nocardia africana]|uniref:hypothetical protein n=1 Tax=Nocardia africana TaxID=134964 RepID=UPI000AAEFD93|nr:hypothetical protein [Nocardia africana]